MTDHLTFVINSDNDFSSLGLLSKSLQDIQRLLRDVDYAIFGSKPDEEWIVHKIESSAPTITVTPNRGDKQAVEIVGDGLRTLTEGTDQPPLCFTEPVLEDLRRMQRLFRGKDKARSLSVLMDGKQTATIDEDIAEQVDRILSAGHHNLGSLQGKLEAINVHKSRTATIWDRVNGAPVQLQFRPEETERVVGLLEKLVVVTGDISYSANGAPRSISNVIAIEDATPARHTERAEFGSIPDQRVKELGAAEWLRRVREGGGV